MDWRPKALAQGPRQAGARALDRHLARSSLRRPRFGIRGADALPFASAPDSGVAARHASRRPHDGVLVGHAFGTEASPVRIASALERASLAQAEGDSLERLERSRRATQSARSRNRRAGVRTMCVTKKRR